MRKLLNTLYILSDGLYLSLKNSNVIVQDPNGEASRFPLHTLESIVTFSRKGLSVPLMEACGKNGIHIFIMNRCGALAAKISPPSGGSLSLRKEQFRLADSRPESLQIAVSVVTGKIRNQIHTLSRRLQDGGDSGSTERINRRIQEMDAVSRDLENAGSVSQVRGLEGEASRIYFSCFNDMIRPDQLDSFGFLGRTKRPPLDNVNAMLSFGYTLLHCECVSALESVGLDPSAGFLHEDRPGRKSLACDLMEELRSSITDRFVLYLINNRIVSAEMFAEQENGGIYLNREGRRIFIDHWQKLKRSLIMHPVLQERIPFGLLPYAQASLLAGFIRGDSESYIPFFRR